MDFKTENERIEKMSNFFKPQAGTTKILFLDNGGEKYKKQMNQKDGTAKTIEQVDFKVEVLAIPKSDTKTQVKIPLTWSLTLGGKSSLYGQVVSVGATRNGLSGTTITLLAQRAAETGNLKYTVLEAIEGMAEPETQDSIGKAAQVAKGYASGVPEANR